MPSEKCLSLPLQNYIAMTTKIWVWKWEKVVADDVALLLFQEQEKGVITKQQFATFWESIHYISWPFQEWKELSTCYIWRSYF